MIRLPLAFSLSATVLAAVVAAPAVAAPWPVNVLVPLPGAPAQVRRYIVDEEPVLAMEDLAPVFALAGSTELVDDDEDPYQHHKDGVDHAYVYQQGGAVFHSTSVLGSESTISKRTNAQVWSSAGTLLTSLGINGYGSFTLTQGAIGKGEIINHKPDGTTVGPNLTHQMASYTVKLAGKMTFGGGSEITVVYGKNAKVAAFSHGLRNLTDGGLHPTTTAADALENMGERADLYNRFTVLKTGLDTVDHVDITGMAFGYYLPDLATFAETIEPVYEVKGIMYGFDEFGNTASVDLLWYEPALADGVLTDLNVWGDPHVNEVYEPLPGDLEKSVD